MGLLYPMETGGSREAAGVARMVRLSVSVLALALFLFATPSWSADQGQPGNEIKLGSAQPYSGPASPTGALGFGAQAYFAALNAKGGINGRKIKYITYDSAYSPPRMFEVTRRLVEQDHVLAVVGSGGTPTNAVVWKYMNEHKTPQIFIWSGAARWGDPKGHPWTMGWVPTYQAEARIYAAYVLQAVKQPKIAILYQNDDYGKEYLVGFKDGLGPAGQKLIVSEQSYETTDASIDSQIVNLKNSGANVLLAATVPKYEVQAIRKAYELGWHPVHFVAAISNGVASVLKPAGLEASKGLITATFVKDPSDPKYGNDKGMREYLEVIKKYNPRGNPYDVLEVFGYSTAQTMEQVLRQCGDDISKENIMRQAANLHNVKLPLLLPGIRINTSPTDFYPIKQLRLARFDGQRWVLFGKLYDTTKMHR